MFALISQTHLKKRNKIHLHCRLFGAMNYGYLAFNFLQVRNKSEVIKVNVGIWLHTKQMSPLVIDVRKR